METESLRLLMDRADMIRVRLEDLRAEARPLEAELEQVKRGIKAMAGLFPPTGVIASRNAVAHRQRMANPDAQELTIKQMVIATLREHLPNGATANELLEAFFRNWGRKEMRTSLSPQLTRLKRDGKIELHGKVWTLAGLQARVEHDLEEFMSAGPMNENEAPSGCPPEPQKPAEWSAPTLLPAWINPQSGPAS